MSLRTKKFLLYSLFILNLVIIFYFWWKSSSFTIQSSPSIILISLGRISGLLLVSFVLLQFMLMGRARWIEEVFGLDKLSKIHHYNGYFILLFLLAHPLLLIVGYSQITKLNLIQQFLDFFSNYPDVWEAIIAVAIFFIIIMLSIYIVRKRLFYELWYGVHLFTYFAIALAWGHQLKNGQDFAQQPFRIYWYLLYIFVFGNVIIYRFLRPLYLFFKYRFRVEKVESEALSAHSIYVTGKNLEAFKIKPGQFLKIRFLNKFWWQDHPFSFSMIPHDNLLRVTIKNSGDFTSHVGDIKKGTPVILDGPYGAFTLDRTNSKKLLFIAGGVGITPIRSLIEQAANNYNIVLLYNNKTSDDIILKDELDNLSKKYNFPIYYIVSQDLSKKYETGHIDAEKIKRLVKDVKDRDIYLCGPPAMMESVRKDLLLLGVHKNQIHFERFSL